jgi:RNA polymerase sigma factor (sigma-70 family)
MAVERAPQMFTITNTVLLEGLSDPGNQSVWTEFDARYRPILVGFAKRMGLAESEAPEAAQRSLVRFAEEYRAGRYERDRGRLRAWLFAIARSQVQKMLRDRARQGRVRGDSALGQLGTDDPALEAWDSEWRQALLNRGMEELRRDTRMDDKTLQVLERITQGHPAAEVAKELDMQVNAVYVAKHRALERLRSLVQRLEEEF